MDTINLMALILSYRNIEDEESKLYQRCREGKGEFEGMDYNTSVNHLYELVRPLQSQRELLAKEIKSLGVGVLIKYPNKVIGARVEKTLRGVSSFSCNTLDKVILSGSKQEGDILTPFLIHLDGSTELTSEEHTYRIKRIDGNVYWILGTKDSLRETYGVERM